MQHPSLLQWFALLLLVTTQVETCEALQQQPGKLPVTPVVADAATTPLTSKDNNNNINLQVGAYTSHWEKLLLAEHQETVDNLRERRQTWSPQKLEDAGFCILGAWAEPDSEILGEKVIRISKSFGGSGITLQSGASLLHERFNRGDVLVLTPLAPKIDAIPRECMVVDVGPDWLTAGVGLYWPPGLWEARKNPQLYPVRIDRAAPQAPLRAQRHALEQLRKGQAGDAALLLARLFHSPTTNDKKKQGDLASHMTLHTDKDPIDFETHLLYALNESKKTSPFTPNQSQENAILWALQRRISLIRGPPGTGKTRTASLLIATALALPQQSAAASCNDDDDTSEPTRVLAVAHSNGAADVLLESLLQLGVAAIRMGRPASISPQVQHRTVVAMAQKVPEVVKLRQKVRDIALDNQERSAASFELKQRVPEIQTMIAKTAPVVVTSCIGAQQLVDDGTNNMVFPIVVVDEAAQTTEPALVCALAAAKAQQIILVGDTRQLPPTVASTSSELRESLGISPMARLEECGVEEFALQEQYRMPPVLLEHPSQYFYKGLLRCAESAVIAGMKQVPPKGFAWPNGQPLAFLQVGNRDSEISHGFGGKSNPAEAEIVADIVSELLDGGDVKMPDIAIISPYSKQVQLIRSELAMKKKALDSIRVGTVDSFQGQETDIVIFSAVRSNPMNELGFLRDSRRLCVAITRARRGLILVGDKACLESCRHWEALIDSCEKRDCIVGSTDWSKKDELMKQAVNSRKDTLELEDMAVDTSDELFGLFDDDGDDDDLFGLFDDDDDDDDYEDDDDIERDQLD